MFDLEYSRAFSDWPYEDLDIPEYWRQSLGETRPIEPARTYEGDIPEEIQGWCDWLGY